MKECTGLGVKDGLRDVDKLYNYRLHQGKTDFSSSMAGSELICEMNTGIVRNRTGSR